MVWVLLVLNPAMPHSQSTVSLPASSKASSVSSVLRKGLKTFRRVLVLSSCESDLQLSQV